MARSAADLALALDVLAGPDELTEGIGYKLALPPPRHDKLADFRVLVIDKHPLCPTAASISLGVEQPRRSARQTGLHGRTPEPESARPGSDHQIYARAPDGGLHRRYAARRRSSGLQIFPEGLVAGR